MRKFSIQIGHGAYTGANAYACAPSIAAAVEILRSRGATRDGARKAVRAALRGSFACCAVGQFGNDVCEVTAAQQTQNEYAFWVVSSEKDRAYLRCVASQLRSMGRAVDFYVS